MQRLSPRNQHWLLGCLAVLHSAAILTLLVLRPWPWAPVWFDRLWVGIATLWFFWPLVLLLHIGRSVLRIAVPLLLAGLIAVPWWRMYRLDAAFVFGLPMGCTLSPFTATRFFAAYLRGRADASRDIRDGHITIEVSGLGAGGFVKPLRDRYGIETRVVAGCVVDESILGHERGYNVVSAAEVKRRLGVDILDRTSGEPKYELIGNTGGAAK